MNLRFLVMALLVCVAGCNAPPDAEGAPTARGVSLRTDVAFDGYIVPRNATELRAPQGTFRVGGWNSDHGWLKLLHLTDDGVEVKEGDIVAKFEFPGDRAKEYVAREIRNAEAQRDQSGVSQSAEVEKLVTTEEQQRLSAEQARLDTLKRGVVSERDWELSKITHQQAIFDADATGDVRKAMARSLRAESAYHERNVARAQSLQVRFDTYTERFQVRAPHDGVLRHAVHRRRGRKVQKGDGMPAGMHFSSLAKDKEVWVQFFVPEARWTELQDAKRFVVESPTSGTRMPVTVHRIEEFPQELGFLKNNEGLPNGREKAYVVWALFDEQPEKLSAGVEVRVRKR